ncbi:MAG TPA: YetF domain-containing protein [Vicinamibacteria bacterium]|nr:YetF domain-containing protein [Vicinamibacteria bacterium]
MDAQELMWTALRSAAVYVLMLIVIRLLGKRTVGNFSAFDLLVALMLGEVVDEMVFGDVPFAQGAAAVLVIAALHFANSWFSYRNPAFGRLTEGAPTPVLMDGKFHTPGMARERMSGRDVLAALRLQGIRDPEDVKLAQVESDGLVSVIKQEWAEPLQKKDLLRALRTRESGGGAAPEQEPVGSAPGAE